MAQIHRVLDWCPEDRLRGHSSLSGDLCPPNAPSSGCLQNRCGELVEAITSTWSLPCGQSCDLWLLSFMSSGAMQGLLPACFPKVDIRSPLGNVGGLSFRGTPNQWGTGTSKNGPAPSFWGQSLEEACPGRLSCAIPYPILSHTPHPSLLLPGVTSQNESPDTGSASGTASEAGR